MDKIFWVIIAFLAGAFLPIQTGMNSRLGKGAKSPLHPSLISFAVGTVALVALYLPHETNGFLVRKKSSTKLCLG